MSVALPARIFVKKSGKNSYYMLITVLFNFEQNLIARIYTMVYTSASNLFNIMDSFDDFPESCGPL